VSHTQSDKSDAKEGRKLEHFFIENVNVGKKEKKEWEKKDGKCGYGLLYIFRIEQWP